MFGEEVDMRTDKIEKLKLLKVTNLEEKIVTKYPNPIQRC